MRCPLCKIELNVAERQGVEVDHCPQCRGVWLDRGELDNILDCAAVIAADTGRLADEWYDAHRHSPKHRPEHSEDFDRDGRVRRKRGGWLAEPLEFRD